MNRPRRSGCAREFTSKLFMLTGAGAGALVPDGKKKKTERQREGEWEKGRVPVASRLDASSAP